eukprot:641859-Prorocentrum_minimum.AAC.3
METPVARVAIQLACTSPTSFPKRRDLKMCSEVNAVSCALSLTTQSSTPRGPPQAIGIRVERVYFREAPACCLVGRGGLLLSFYSRQNAPKGSNTAWHLALYRSPVQCIELQLGGFRKSRVHNRRPKTASICVDLSC